MIKKRINHSLSKEKVSEGQQSTMSNAIAENVFHSPGVPLCKKIPSEKPSIKTKNMSIQQDLSEIKCFVSTQTKDSWDHFNAVRVLDKYTLIIGMIMVIKPFYQCGASHSGRDLALSWNITRLTPIDTYDVKFSAKLALWTPTSESICTRAIRCIKCIRTVN